MSDSPSSKQDLSPNPETEPFHQERISSSTLTTIKTIFQVGGFITGAIFTIGGVFLGHHFAQDAANSCRCTVYWSPYLAFIIAVLGLIGQMFWFMLPLECCSLRNLLKEYSVVTVTKAKVIARKKTGTAKHPVFNVFLAYTPYPEETSVVYVKKVTVKQHQFSTTSWDVLVLPGVPTSMILKQAYDQAVGCSEQNMAKYALTLATPVMWYFAIKYNADMQRYSNGTFWATSGMPIMLIVSLVSGFLLAIATIARKYLEMLYLAKRCNVVWDGMGQNGNTDSEEGRSSLELV